MAEYHSMNKNDHEQGPCRKLSIVIPVYNRERWVAEAIESVLSQSYDPHKVEVVLVDDGSTDGSHDVLTQYAAKYPDRVRHIRQENKGVATALNKGVELATGDVVGFLGSDDYLEDGVARAVIEFFNQHWGQVDLAAIGLEMVGERTGPHWGNGKRFESTRIIDVDQDWNNPQICGGGSFIKVEMFRERGHSFDPELFITEDATLNTQVIMEKMAYGVISGVRYFNRRYSEGADSLVASSHYKKAFYTVIPEHAHQRMLDDARERFGYVPYYVQGVVMYDLKFRFRATIAGLDDAEVAAYRELFRNLLKQISVYVIMKSKCVIEQRLNMLDLREANRLSESAVFADGVYSLEDTRVYSYDRRRPARHRPQRCIIDNFMIRNDEAIISGRLGAVLFNERSEMFAVVDDQEYRVRLTSPLSSVSSYLSNSFVTGRQFTVRAPLPAGSRLSFVLVVDAQSEPYRCPLVLEYGRHARMSGTRRSGFFRDGGSWTLRQQGNYSVSRHAISGAKAVRSRLGFAVRALRSGARLRDVALRLALTLRDSTPTKDVWLLADHKSEAGDNGEAMFEYLSRNRPNDVTPVFALSKDSEHYNRVSALGEVVEPNSRKFFKRYFQASVFLNSAADEYMINPLGSRRIWFQDLLPETSVFLQHGVTKDDQSAWLNKPRKGFDVFVTSAERERDSIVEGPYGYDSADVVLTGMPRFDQLENNPEKLIIFAPTWRKALAGELDRGSGRSLPNPAFSGSEYFRNWQSVITDRSLNRLLSEAGYRGLFAIHPSHASEIPKFASGSVIDVCEYPFDYKRFFEQSSILVTDYSSVAFDFAYLRKPVVYFQPDRESFFLNHLYGSGFYSYVHDGFGPVVFSIPELVSAISRDIESDASVSDAFRARIDSFFAYEGDGNSARLYDAIVRIRAPRSTARQRGHDTAYENV